MYKNKKSNMAIIITITAAVLILLVILVIIIFQKTSDNNKTNNTTVGTTIATTNLTTTNPTTSSTTTTTPTTTTTTTPNTKTGNENFEITQWGVTGYYNGSYTVDYQITYVSNEDVYMVNFSTPDSPTECQGRVLKTLRRYLPNDTISYYGHLAVDPPILASQAGNTWPREKIVHIGEYYYVFDTGATDYCPGLQTDAGADVESNVSSGLRNFFSTLVAV